MSHELKFMWVKRITFGQLEDCCSLFWQYLPTFFDQIFIDDHISTTQHDIVSILENNIEYGVKIDYKSLKKLYLPLVDNREQVKWKFLYPPELARS